MFENIEKVIRDDIGKIYIEEERYDSGLLVGFDLISCNRATNYPECTVFYEGNEVAAAIDIATSPGDMDALTALFKLVDFAEQHPEFLFARAKTLGEAFILLESRAGLWNQLSIEQKEALMLGFVAYKGCPY